MQKALLRAILSSGFAWFCGFASAGTGAGKPAQAPQGQEPAPLSRAEASLFVETSRLEDIELFGTRLERRSDLLRRSTFGKTVEGRPMPLWVIADPPISTAQEAKASGKLVVLVMANIHAGEVEGKEAAQQIARRLATGDLKPLLDKLVVLIVPDYNADGNEKIDPAHRPEQYGPIGGLGVRENAQGLDLNRDFIKLDAPESRALVKLMNEWDPALTVDLHTTDGSYHGYHLTYSIPLNPMTSAAIADYHRAKMMPAIAEAMLKTHGLRTYYYGNFEQYKARPEDKPERVWKAFTHQPRIGQNYIGLRNRLTILSEAYSYLSFRKRIEATEAFVGEILKFAHDRSGEIARELLAADRAAGDPAAKPGDWGVSFEFAPVGDPLEILVGKVSRLRHPMTGRSMSVMVENEIAPTLMRDIGGFRAVRLTPRPIAYVFKPAPELDAVIDRLRAHGVAIERLEEPLTGEFAVFTPSSVTHKPRAFQGHKETIVAGESVVRSETFPAGSLLVSVRRPLGALASYLLEPESDDGLTTWNFFDKTLETGRPHPIHKLLKVSKDSTKSEIRDR